MTAIPRAAGPATAPRDARAAGGRRLRARYRRIVSFAVGIILQLWWCDVLLPRIGLGAWSERTRTARLARAAARFRELAADLGGLMIKVGQFLSARLDVLPAEVTDELASLQDEVSAADPAEVRALAERELGVALETVLAEFEERPIAAASLGQAHRARLGTEDSSRAGFSAVVVKIQRPGIEGVVATDLRAIRRIAAMLARVRTVSRRVDLPALVREFADASSLELDYLHEAANAERFREAFAGDPRVGAPEVVWELTTARVLVLEDVTGIKITDLSALRKVGIEPHEVAEDLAGAMLDQLFVDGFFHADPHPGNLFVTPVDLRDDGTGPVGADEREEQAARRRWRVTFIDFGMMGEIPDAQREGLQELLIAAAMRDGRRMAAALLRIGVIVPGSDTAALERAMSEAFAQFGGMSAARLRDLDAGALADVAERFQAAMRATHLQLPENFLLLFRAVALLSGVCSALEPGFSLWDAAGPYASRLMREAGGGSASRLLTETGRAISAAARLPVRLERVIDLAEKGRLPVEVPETERLIRRLERLVRRLIAAVVFAGLFVGGVLLQPISPALGVVAMVASTPALLLAIAGGRGRR